MLTSLRRAATVVAAAAITIGASAGAALAFPSGGNPGSTGPNHIEWTGQGATNGQLDTSACDAANDPNGANQPYLLWVFTTDGGSVDPSSALLNLQVNGQPVAGDPFGQAQPLSSNSIHFVTPYYTPDNTLAASANFNVTSPGNGSWNLVISHGCAGPARASPPTVTKDAAGAYNTTNIWSIQKAVDKTEVDVNPSGQAVFNYSVTATNTGSSNNHIVVNGTIDVSNPDGAAINVANVVDHLSDGVSCPFAQPAQLYPGDTKIPYSCSLPDNSDLSGLTNTVDVSWADQTLGDGSFLAAGDASFTTPTIQFTQGTVANNCVSVDDSFAGHLGQECTGSSPQTFTYTRTISGGDLPAAGSCQTYDNTATITSTDQNGGQLGNDSKEVKVCTGAPLTVAKNANAFFQRAYTWNLTKAVLNGPVIKTAGPGTAFYSLTVTHDAGTDSNWQVLGHIHVTNPNTWESVSLTGVTDSIDNGGQCSITSGDPNGSIAAGATADLAYQCTYASAPSPSAFTNTATATWDAQAASTDNGSAQGTATGDFASATPNIVDGSMHVTDSLGGDLGSVSISDPNPTKINYQVLFPSDPAGTCTTHNNTATATASDSGATSTDSATVKVCVGADLKVTKTATPSFQRTYNWAIAKQADKTLINPGGTVNYSVGVTQTGVTDSGWQVSGAITVVNPNDWEAVTTAVSDNIDNGGQCTVGGPAVSIPASGQGTLPYTCTFSSNPGSGVNQALAQWDPALSFTPDASATGHAPYQFGAPTTRVNQTIHVVDSQAGPLGTVTGTDSQPFASKTFTYSKQFQPPASGCTTINNTATITETGQNASASVKECSVGALTMGFWQNKNGGGILNGASQAALGNWLQGLGPAFSDAPTSGAASSVAAYFAKVFNAANAAGTGAPMLKAQLLATALDVYFSDTSLGGQKIGAFNGNGSNQVVIGGVKIDVSAWSSAFGGATSMTVMQMLQYTASHSTAGGTAFYGGDKTLTTTAITAFNAVNNDAAPIAP